MTVVTPAILLQAYRMGVFPMADARDAAGFSWYDPQTRGILPLEAFHVPRRLARTVLSGIYRVTINRDFDAVIRACAAARRDTWINDGIIGLYAETHRAGYAHSVEVRDASGALAGGLYGLAINGAFFGESMFSTARDASKVALVHLAARLRRRGFSLLDAQFPNPHLSQFGCIEISRADYHARLAAALSLDVSFVDAYSAAGATDSGVADSGAVSGVSSVENSESFADAAEFLQSITQTS